jgi:hypothetical protein
MRKQIFTLNSILFGLATLLLLSACGNQIYSYRSKVKVDQQETTAKTEKRNVFEIGKKEMAIIPVNPMLKPEFTLVQTEKTATNRTLTKTEKRTLKITHAISEIVPVSTGPAAIKSASINQGKAALKDVKKAALGGIDGKQWMIVGLIIMLVAVVLGFLTGVSFFYGIGVLIFLVGLIIFLIENLT